MRNILRLALFFAVALQAIATNAVYIAQASAGANDGTSCANAKAATYFNSAGNWSASPTGIQIGPGTTVHLCATITTILTAQLSGAAGNPVTILFESGAILSQTGASNVFGFIDITSLAYVTVDGNGVGVIEATANGDLLANQNILYGVNIASSNHIEVRNLTVRHLYDHGGAAHDTAAGWSRGITVSESDDVNIHHNTLYDIQVGVWHYAVGQSHRLTICDNTFYNLNWGAGLTSAGADSVLDTVNFCRNDVKISTNWDDPDETGGTFHHNGLYAFTEDSGVLGTVSNLTVDSNKFYGEPGGWISTAQVFTSGRVTPTNIINNIFDETTGGANGIEIWPEEYTATVQVLNNTFKGHTTGTYTYSSYPTVNTNAVYMTGSESAAFTFKNNHIETFSVGLLAGAGAATVTSDYNNLYDLANLGVLSSTYYTTLAAWQGAGYDAHGISSAPMLTSFIPQAGSPLIGAGVNLTSLGISALDSDKAGNARPSMGAWDIGANQYASAGPTSTPRAIPLGFARKLGNAH